MKTAPTRWIVPLIAASLLLACDPSPERVPSGQPPDGSTIDDADVGTSEPPEVPELFSDVVVDLSGGLVTPLPQEIRSVLGISAANYAVSPDGSRIAFEGAAEGYVSNRLYVANIDGSDVHLATEEPVIARTPAWSPDGERIVYVGAPGLVEVPGPAAIAVLDVRSGESTTLLRAAGDIWLPSFSPDGTSILFTRGSPYRLNLWSVPASGGPPRVVRRDAAFGVLSPDGRLLAFREPGDPVCFIECSWTPTPGIALAEVSANGAIGRRAVVLDGPSEPEPNHGWPAVADGWEGSRPVWSPEGGRIAYMDGRQRWGRIRVVDVRSGAATTVGKGTLPTWLDADALIVHRI